MVEKEEEEAAEEEEGEAWIKKKAYFQICFFLSALHLPFIWSVVDQIS